jgi:sugar diacid utilization regulator
MSDGHTNIRRDQQRSERYDLFLEQLAAYLTEPSDTNRAELMARAKATDEIPRGYRTGRTALESTLTDERLTRLVEKDETEWKFLLDSHQEAPAYQLLVKLSPFADATV